VILCDTLLMDIQPAHLQLHSGRKLSPDERDAIRAEIVRSRLLSLASPDNSSTSGPTKPLSDPTNPGDE
jgi:protein arginine kinase